MAANACMCFAHLVSNLAELYMYRQVNGSECGGICRLVKGSVAVQSETGWISLSIRPFSEFCWQGDWRKWSSSERAGRPFQISLKLKESEAVGQPHCHAEIDSVQFSRQTAKVSSCVFVQRSRWPSEYQWNAFQHCDLSVSSARLAYK